MEKEWRKVFGLLDAISIQIRDVNQTLREVKEKEDKAVEKMLEDIRREEQDKINADIGEDGKLRGVGV